MVKFKFDLDKTIATIAYLAEKQVPDLDKYKVGKLLFLADKYHLVRFGRIITGDEYCAMEHGPAPSSTINILTGLAKSKTSKFHGAGFEKAFSLDTTFKYPRLLANFPTNRKVLSESDIRALDHTIEIYGHKTFPELRAITHEMYCYKTAWKNRGSKKSARMKFEDFFEEDSDAIDGVMEELLETNAALKAFPPM